MKLAILTQYYPPEVGAPQARLSELAKLIREAGHEVEVLTAMPNYPTGKILPGYGGVFRRDTVDGTPVGRVPVFPSKSRKLAPRLASYLSFVATSATMGPFVLGPCDFLLVESPPIFLGASGIFLKTAKRARLIFNVSDLWPASMAWMGVLKESSFAYQASLQLEAVCYRSADLITAQTIGIAEDIRHRFPGKDVYHLSNGVDTSLFSPTLATREARMLLGGPAGFVVLYAGLHGMAQGLEQLLDAAAAMRAEAGVRFVLVGDGPDKDALRQRVVSEGLTNVTMLDPVPKHQVPALVAAADAIAVTLGVDLPGCVPSKFYEAIASAKPVVLVARGEVRDMANTYELGPAINPGDIPALVARIQSLANSPEEARALGERGRKVAQAHYDRRDIATKFIRKLEEVQRRG